MKALVFDEFGPADVLHVAEVAAPEPGSGQIRITARAASVNPVDWKIRSGASAAFHSLSFPAITGFDAAGVVDRIGEGVVEFQLGDEVFGSTGSGAAAEFVLLDSAARKPATMEWATAAGLPSAVETGYRALEFSPVREGGILVVNGVAGGVGLAVAQFALARGIRVIGTASPARHEFLGSIGVEPIAYGDDLASRIQALGVEIAGVVDVAGNGSLPELLRLVDGDPARVVTLSDRSAADLGVFYSTGAEGRHWEALAEAAELWTQGRFVMPVARVVDLDDGATAHRLSESGHTLGKVVIAITP